MSVVVMAASLSLQIAFGFLLQESGDTLQFDPGRGFPQTFAWSLVVVALFIFEFDRRNRKKLEKSAESGNSEAMYQLGLLYYDGNTVKRDYRKAVELFTPAAEKGHPKAQNNLGVIYGKGQGTTKNVVTSYMWFTLASLQGGEESEKNRQAISKAMTQLQIEEAELLAKELQVQIQSRT